jgi:hypothetical protein
MKLKVLRNTYPKHPKVAHAEVDDLCYWQEHKGRKELIRYSDNKVVFSRELLPNGQHDGNRPVMGVVACNKSKGWFLELYLEGSCDEY